MYLGAIGLPDSSLLNKVFYPDVFRGFPVMPFVIIALVLFFASRLARSAGRDSVYSATAVARVTEIEDLSYDGDYATFFPVLRYEVEGREYAVKFRVVCERRYVPEIGDEIEILYNPDDPADCVTNH